MGPKTASQKKGADFGVRGNEGKVKARFQNNILSKVPLWAQLYRKSLGFS